MNISEKKQIKKYLLEYLKIDNPKITFIGNKNLFKCPVCKKEKPTANFYPNIDTKLHCFDCNFTGDVFELVKKTKKPFEKSNDDEIGSYLKHKLKIKIKDELSDLLIRYEKSGFHMFPLNPNSKVPQSGFKWKENSVCNKKVWLDWLDRGYGLSLKLGKDSKVVALDIDDDSAYDQVKSILGETLTQSTARGKHFIYKYEDIYDNINHNNMRTSGFEGEIRCNNAYVVVAPTSVEGEERTWNDGNIIKMPKELKTFIFDKIKTSKKEMTVDENIQEAIDCEKIGIVDLKGNRNDTFVKLAGILRKKMPPEQAEYALNVISNNLIDKPIPRKELRNIIGQIKKYNLYDKDELAKIVLDRLEVTKEASAFQISATLKQEQKDIEDVLKYLTDQEKIIRLDTGRYKKLDKVEWVSGFDDMSNPITFEMPYFGDYAYFDWGDMIIIGGKSGTGKGHIVGNIIKKLETKKEIDSVDLISTEAGSKIGKVMNKLQINPDFVKRPSKPVKDPTTIELRDGHVTIIDWLSISDFSKTNLTMEQLHNQLKIHKGFLIVMVQLTKEGKFFADNLLDFYASFVATYNYESSGGKVDNENTFFKTHKIRDSKSGLTFITIPTKFDIETKLLELRK